MRFFKQLPSQKENHFKARIIDKDEEEFIHSDYPYDDKYDNEDRKVDEVENTLFDALTTVERSNGSLLCLQKFGTNSAVEMGRRISSLRSPEEMGVSGDVKLNDSETLSSASRSSSLHSARSMPTFIKVERGNTSLAQKSWDAITSDSLEDDKRTTNTGCNSSSANVNEFPTSRRRSWTKLRREVKDKDIRFKENARIPLVRRFGSRIKKKNSPDSLNSNKLPNSSFKEQRNNRSEGTNSTCSRGDVSNNKNNYSLNYAKDYAVEVSLQDRKTNRRRRSSRREGKCKNVPSTSTRSQLNYDNNINGNNHNPKEIDENDSQKIQTDHLFVKNDATTVPTEDPDAPAEEAITETSKVVVQIHNQQINDFLFEALEVICCVEDALDMITEMVPPQS
ncbi:MAG: hypothetical protein ACI8RD_004841 [Bacillariaceae sp.]|jgi:hypothetical protein